MQNNSDNRFYANYEHDDSYYLHKARIARSKYMAEFSAQTLKKILSGLHKLAEKLFGSQYHVTR